MYILILYIFIYFIYYFFKDYYIVFVLLKKNEKGLRGKQQFELFTQYQDIFSHFSTFYVKTFAFFKLILYISHRKVRNKT